MSITGKLGLYEACLILICLLFVFFMIQGPVRYVMRSLTDCCVV